MRLACTSMEHAGGGGAAHAAVEEDHLPGAGARCVDDEPAGVHGGSKIRDCLTLLMKGELYMYG
jgi:hypothetical protein